MTEPSAKDKFVPIQMADKEPCCIPDTRAGPAPPMPSHSVDTQSRREKTTVETSHASTLHDLIAAINKELGPRIGLAEASSEKVDHLQQLMRSYVSNSAEWEPYAHWHPQRYTRNLIDDGNGAYNLLLLCWPKGIQRYTSTYPLFW